MEVIKIAENNNMRASTNQKPKSGLADKLKNKAKKLLKNPMIKKFIISHLPIIIMIILGIIFIIYLIGLISFFMTMPGLVLGKIKEFGASVWGNFQAAITGDTTTVKVKEEDVVGLAQYLQNMGYDVQTFGFGNIKYTDDSVQDGRKTKIVEKVIKKPLLPGNTYYEDKNYLRAYIAANEATYTLSTYSLNGFLNALGEEFSKINFLLSDNSDKPKGIGNSKSFSSGMINIMESNSSNLTSSSYEVSIDREKGKMNISNKVSLWGKITGNAKINMLSYDIDTYVGRYGRPTELFLALHIATMMPDLTYEIATSQKFNTKVNLRNQSAFIQYKVKVQNVDGTSIGNNEIINLFLNNCVEGISSEDSFTSVMQNIGSDGISLIESDQIISGTPWTINQISEYASLVYNGISGIGNVKWPYIDSVRNHWYYEDINFAKSAYRLAKTATKTLEYVSEKEDKNNEITLEAEISASHGIVYQVCEPEVKGPNQRIKDVFSQEYYKYDGTNENAKKIYNAKAISDGKSKYNYGGEKYTVSKSEEDIASKQKVNFSDVGLRTNALSAFSILKNVHTEAADYIYRNLKRLMEDLKYFSKAELMEDLTQELLWPIKTDDHNQTWETKADKGEYGLKILCNKVNNKDENIVISPSDGIIESVAGHTIKIKFGSISDEAMELLLYMHKDDYKIVDRDLLNGMTLLIENVSPNSSITTGKTIKRGDELGKALKDIDSNQTSITILLKSADGETVKNILSEKTKGEKTEKSEDDKNKANGEPLNTEPGTELEDIDSEKIYSSQVENFYDYFDQKDNSKYEDLILKKMQQEASHLTPLDLSNLGAFSAAQQYNNRILTTAEQEQVARYVWDFFKSQGWDEIHIAGVLGNFQGESSMNPGLVEEDSGEGIGLAQWSFGRKQELLNYAAQRGTHWSDIQTQLDFLINVDSDGPTTRKYLNTSFSTISDAVYWWATYWERPDEKALENSMPTRAGAGNTYYDKFSGT